MLAQDCPAIGINFTKRCRLKAGTLKTDGEATDAAEEVEDSHSPPSPMTITAMMPAPMKPPISMPTNSAMSVVMPLPP